jgi:hypothetical protein
MGTLWLALRASECTARGGRNMGPDSMPGPRQPASTAPPPLAFTPERRLSATFRAFSDRARRGLSRNYILLYVQVYIPAHKAY